MVYMITFTINTPPMLAYIYHTWILWVNILMNKTAKIKNCNLHIGQFEASARPPHWIPWRQGTRSIFQKMCSPRRHFLHMTLFKEIHGRGDSKDINLQQGGTIV